jgi:hypothetical protein
VKLYKHHKLKHEYALLTDEIAWINRITVYKEEYGRQVLAGEMWLIMLLNWGYLPYPHNYHMTETWCQKWIAFDTVNGGLKFGGFPVRDK